MKTYIIGIDTGDGHTVRDVTAEGYRVLENGDVYFFKGDPKEANIVLTVARGKWNFIQLKENP